MEDRCVCCGAIIPEGSWACPNCLLNVKEVDCNEDNERCQSSL